MKTGMYSLYIYCIICLCLVCIPSTKSFHGSVHRITKFSFNRFGNRISTNVMAKKKGKSLVSDELLRQIEEFEKLENQGASSVQNSEKESDLLKEALSENHNDKKDKKKKKKDNNKDGKSNQIEFETDQISHDNDQGNIQSNSVEATPVQEKTVERKAKPSTRIRLTESTQPDFVMLGLEEVSLLFGNEVIVKNSTFSVVSGERVGLVGPNGAGKVIHIFFFDSS